MVSIKNLNLSIPVLQQHINAVQQRSVTFQDVRTAVEVFHGHLKQLEKLPPEVGVATVEPVQIREAHAAAEQFLGAVAQRAVDYSKSNDREQQALSGHISLLKRQVHALKLRTGDAVEEEINFGVERKFRALLLEWLTERTKIDHQEPLHQEDIQTLRKIYSELAESPEKTLMLDLIGEYEKLRRQVDALSSPGQGTVLVGANYARARSEALSEFISQTAQTSTEKMLAEIKQYPGFLKLLIEDKAIANLFQLQVIRDGLPLAVFVEHPSVAQFLRNSGSFEKSLTMAGEGKGIRIEDDQLPAIRLEGQWIKVHDLPMFDEAPDRMKVMNTGNWYLLGMHQESKTLSRVYIEQAQQNPIGYIHTSAEGLVGFNSRTWSFYDQEAAQWKPVNLHTDDWWKQLPAYRSEQVAIPEDESGYVFNYVVSHTEDGLQLGDTHSYTEIGIPVRNEDGQLILDGDGLVTVNYYPFGVFAHFFKGTSKAMQNIRGELFYIDQDNMLPDRRRVMYSQSISSQNADTAFDNIRWERIITLLQAGLVQTTDGEVVALSSLADETGHINLGLAGLKMMDDGQIRLMQVGELGGAPVLLTDVLSRGFVGISKDVSRIAFMQQADGSIVLKPIFNLAYHNCSNFVKRVAESIGIDLVLKVRFGSTSSLMMQIVVKILAALRFLMDFVCWILGLRDSAADPLRIHQEHFKNTGELNNPYGLVQLAKLLAEIAEMRRLLERKPQDDEPSGDLPGAA